MEQISSKLLFITVIILAMSAQILAEKSCHSKCQDHCKDKLISKPCEIKCNAQKCIPSMFGSGLSLSLSLSRFVFLLF